MTPMRFKYASSASASAGACVAKLNHNMMRKVAGAYHPPFKSERINDGLHARNELVTSPVDFFPSLDIRSFGSIKDEERKEGGVHKSRTAKK